jgi:peptidoglycan hydrolase CwlO-like protein
MRVLGPRYARALAGAVAAVVVAATAPGPASADDLGGLQDRAQSVADQVTRLEQRLASLRPRRDRLNAAIDDLNLEISGLELRRQRIHSAYEKARNRYVASAVTVYKSHSPMDNLGLILSAESYSDMVSLAHVANSAAAAAETELARLDRARAETERLQQRIDSRKQRLIASAAELEGVTDGIHNALSQRQTRLAELNDEIRKLEAAARREAARASSPGDELENLLGAGPTTGIPDGFVGTGVTFEGEASWYGPGFEGNTTANGEIFDPDKYTAASKELAFGTWLLVEHEGRGVAVRINDRGPYAGNRILDLSRAAAEAIGISGVGWVRAEIIIKK